MEPLFPLIKYSLDQVVSKIAFNTMLRLWKQVFGSVTFWNGSGSAISTYGSGSHYFSERSFIAVVLNKIYIIINGI